MIQCWNCGTRYKDSRSGEVNGVYIGTKDIYCDRCGARPRMVRKSLFVETLLRLKPREARQFMEDARVLTDDLTQFLIDRVLKEPLRVDELDQLWSAQPLRRRR